MLVLTGLRQALLHRCWLLLCLGDTIFHRTAALGHEKNVELFWSHLGQLLLDHGWKIGGDLRPCLHRRLPRNGLYARVLLADACRPRRRPSLGSYLRWRHLPWSHGPIQHRHGRTLLRNLLLYLRIPGTAL